MQRPHPVAMQSGEGKDRGAITKSETSAGNAFRLLSVHTSADDPDDFVVLTGQRALGGLFEPSLHVRRKAQLHYLNILPHHQITFVCRGRRDAEADDDHTSTTYHIGTTRQKCGPRCCIALVSLRKT